MRANAFLAQFGTALATNIMGVVSCKILVKRKIVISHQQNITHKEQGCYAKNYVVYGAYRRQATQVQNRLAQWQVVAYVIHDSQSHEKHGPNQ